MMKKLWICLLVCFLWACGKENTFKGKEYIYASQQGVQITLGFDSQTNRYFGKGINKYFGQYDVNGNKITFHTPSSTMMMGDSFDMIEEEKFLNLLSQIDTFSITENELTLISKNGKKFTLLRKITNKKDMNYEH